MSRPRVLACLAVALVAFGILSACVHARPQSQAAAHRKNGCDGNWQPGQGQGRRCKVDVDQVIAQQDDPNLPHDELIISRSNHEGFVFDRSHGEFRIGHVTKIGANAANCPDDPFKTHYDDRDPENPDTGRPYGRHHDTGEPGYFPGDPDFCEYKLYIQHRDGSQADPHIGLTR